MRSQPHRVTPSNGGSPCLRSTILAPEFRGKVVVDGYAGRRLVVGGSADAELRNLDVDELILWSQPGGEISAAGRATTLSQMDNEGTIVTDGLDYRYLDRSLVEELMAE